MDEKVECKYRLRWLSQGSISKVPQSMVDASLELYPIPYFTLFVRAAPIIYDA